MRRERVPPAVAAEVLARAQAHCEACGWPAGELALHHRKRRSQGGRHTVENLIAVHPSCHDRIHSRQDEAYARGFLVHRGDDPASVPVRPSARWAA